MTVRHHPNPSVNEQMSMCYSAASRPTRLYMAVVELRDVGMTRDEFRKVCQRRPEHYALVAYLADVSAFWGE